MTPDERFLLIERAAIIEFDGNVPRKQAEYLAKEQAGLLPVFNVPNVTRLMQQAVRRHA